MEAASDELLKEIEDEGCWDGVRGTPGVRSSETGLSFSHKEVPISGSTDAWIDVQPDPVAPGFWWILLLTGSVGRFSADSGELVTILEPGDLGFPMSPAISVRVSPDGGFVAIFESHGRMGRVFDLRTQACTTSLDRGNYRPETSHFPITFFRSPIDGRTLLVSATAWCRLDIFDPSNGEVLTTREFEKTTGGKARPHGLDYFHGGLSISPDNRWIADGGWAWHPAGIIRTWSIERWLGENPWESEDGASVRNLAQRDYFWDGPSCWIDRTTLAVWGWGNDDEWLLPGVCLFDIATGQELGWFPGPSGRKPRWPRAKDWPSLFFDELLFSTDGENGMSVWDVGDGCQLLEDPGLNPIGYHSGSKEFLTLIGERVRLSRLTK
ncbi:hypothetical protein OKA04_18955 [Luteolibacter flavescens]|uniref:Uncharacterized protein n=1 Tax=Luteolibacter flavescens TaxID=1859460 RepID=A0ABT3FTD5_9BACT|nr:hypothetical protein [Luteolibacter flavescens]MCW1886827.1 hypothetical protein [Luteolibacter flavescens]